ncbi:hypothetical protein O7632_00690 [Solwaraspora sp. WMMD406]|uniref:hypothetical protein n=1 Tax=Solwaraspora sp. WMMD406 TaxID=3016095 RepID=UPI0024163F60|nr:hypothetical protein [Solwaraspora sp. WMMD406]MDG4762640.1 hypothetical protein [Solwaraspora sp. WMMD406]
MSVGPAYPGTLDGRSSRLELLRPGVVFAYVFELGEDWTHACTTLTAVDTVPAHRERRRWYGT